MLTLQIATGCSRTRRFTSFFRKVLAPRQNCCCPHSESFRCLMECSSEFRKNDVQLIRVPGCDHLGTELTDAVIEAARALGHGTVGLLPDEQRILFLSHRKLGFDTLRTVLTQPPGRANEPARSVDPLHLSQQTSALPSGHNPVHDGFRRAFGNCR